MRWIPLDQLRTTVSRVSLIDPQSVRSQLSAMYVS